MRPVYPRPDGVEIPPLPVVRQQKRHAGRLQALGEGRPTVCSACQEPITCYTVDGALRERCRCRDTVVPLVWKAQSPQARFRHVPGVWG